jgi:protein-S-isoprenylcysteine O-methyltransferase Ste14
MNGSKHQILILAGTAASLVSACMGLMTQDSNHLGSALLYSSLVCFAAGSYYLFLSRKRTGRERGPTDKSLRMILPGIMMVGLLSPVEFLVQDANDSSGSLPQDIGSILFCAGALLGIWSRCILEWWDLGDNSWESDPRLKRLGAYQILRFPGFAGLFLMALGISVGYSSTIGVLSVLLLLLPGLVYRILVENKEQVRERRLGTT